MGQWYYALIVLIVIYWLYVVSLYCIWFVLSLVGCCFCVVLCLSGSDVAHRRAREMAQKVGAKNVVEKLQKDTKHYGDLGDKSKQMTECVICTEEFKEIDNVSELPCDSRHVFHTACLSTWMEKQTKCPLCKQEVKAI